MTEQTLNSDAISNNHFAFLCGKCKWIAQNKHKKDRGYIMKQLLTWFASNKMLNDNIFHTVSSEQKKHSIALVRS